jgi:hypothetical protein
MSAKLPSVKEASWRQVVDQFDTSGLSAKEFCQSKAISLRSFYCWRRKIKLNDQRLDRTSNRQMRDQRQLAIVPIKVISERNHLDTPPFLADPKTPSVRINLANRIVVEIFSEVQP